MADSKKKRVFEKTVFWSKHIEAWHRSDLTQGAYCRQHGLSLSSLRYWRARLDKSGSTAHGAAVTFVPVPLSAPSPAATGMPESMLVHVGDNFRIEIRGDFTTAVFEKLVRTLARL